MIKGSAYVKCGFCLLLLLAVACSKQVSKAESDTFEVNVSESFTGEWLDVAVRDKRTGATRDLLSIERDKEVGLRFLDDSTLVITDIWARSDGHMALITNLEVAPGPCLDCRIGSSVIRNDTLTLTSVAGSGWSITTARKLSRDDILVVGVQAPPQRKEPAEPIVILGADDVAVDSIANDVLAFTCVWRGSHSNQSFSVNVSDLFYEPQDFSLCH